MILEFFKEPHLLQFYAFGEALYGSEVLPIESPAPIEYLLSIDKKVQTFYKRHY